MAETTEQLLASIRRLRGEYQRALAIRRELVGQRRQIAAEIRNWARAHRELMAAERRAEAWFNDFG